MVGGSWHFGLIRRLLRATLEGAHSFARFWRQISSFSRYFLETLTETGCIHWVGIQTSAKGQGVGSLFFVVFFPPQYDHQYDANKFFTQKNFVTQNFFLRKFFLTRKFFYAKIFLTQKIFYAKNFDPKFFLCKKFFYAKFFTQNFFSVKKIFA